MIDHRAILKKLLLQEYDFFGECQTVSGGSLDDGASGYVQFTDAEKAEVRAIADEAHVDWMVGRFDSCGQESAVEKTPATLQPPSLFTPDN